MPLSSPLDRAPLICLDSVDSTQNYAASLLVGGQPVGGVLSKEQTGGRGRFGRPWYSPAGESLSVSLVFRDLEGHSRPYLIGMTLAVAAARAFDCQVRWPNDIVCGEKKLGGILTEMLPDQNGIPVPIVGVGINLNQSHFPEEIAPIATSVRQQSGKEIEPKEALEQILVRLESLPEPNAWLDLQPHWLQVDNTPGKRYRLQDGRSGLALSVGSEGELICLVEGREEQILAADAILGP